MRDAVDPGKVTYSKWQGRNPGFQPDEGQQQSVLDHSLRVDVNQSDTENRGQEQSEEEEEPDGG